jgi:hypothetical protein
MFFCLLQFKLVILTQRSSKILFFLFGPTIFLVLTRRSSKNFVFKKIVGKDCQTIFYQRLFFMLGLAWLELASLGNKTYFYLNIAFFN